MILWLNSLNLQISRERTSTPTNEAIVIVWKESQNLSKIKMNPKFIKTWLKKRIMKNIKKFCCCGFFAANY